MNKEAINLESVPQVVTPPVIPEEMLQWKGDPIEHSLTIGEILAANVVLSLNTTDVQKQKAFDFYNGEQWDVLRERDARPSLVLNQLHHIVSRAIHNSRVAGQYFFNEIEPDWASYHELILIVTLRNMDAQRLFNYVHTIRLANMMMMNMPHGWAVGVPVNPGDILTINGLEWKVQ